MPPLRALVVTNMWPSPPAPALGSFVRDQVEALRGLEVPGLEVDVFAFPPGGYARAARDVRAHVRATGTPDVVHAHFGLTAWPALAAPARVRLVTLHGTDVRHPRSRRITAAAVPLLDCVATAGGALAADVPGRPRRTAVLPCGVAARFRPQDRRAAREALGLDAAGRYLLFPADPARAEKRHDRAAAVAEATGATLLTAGAVAPERMPLWVNAANAVVVPSEREGFGLAVLEALACDVPVLATPVGVHPAALDGIDGTLCAAFDAGAWAAAAAPHLDAPDPRIAGAARAALYGSAAMAERVVVVWRELLGRPGEPPPPSDVGTGATFEEGH